MKQPLDVSVEDHVAVVTLNTPTVNAQTTELMEALIAAFDGFNDDKEVRAVILTGSGHVFSAGADLKNRIKTGAEPGVRWGHLRRVRETFYSVMECQKPVIAAVNGPALGAGLALAASCDIMLASDRASFGLPEIDVGLMGGARHAMELFGRSLTRRMVLTGYRVPASELYRLGIIEACTSPEELMPTAMAMARDIARKSAYAIRMSKRTLNTIDNLSLRDGYRFEQNMTAEVSLHKDSKESMTAFVEKRPATYDD
jgi:enoyl-CoA hydratase/carnithine racemase